MNDLISQKRGPKTTAEAPVEASRLSQPVAGGRATDHETAEELARRLSLPFRDLRLLNRALTHRSYLNEHTEALEDNERLEFLGDAVLDFLVGAWLYQNYPEMREGQLTRLRSALVNTEQLANFARQIRLGAALKLGRGEDLSGGRERDMLLCAGFEALVGALYLEAGLPAVQAFVEPFMAVAAEQILARQGDQDAKSQLQQVVQAHGCPPPKYVTLSIRGPEHDRTFEVEVVVGSHPLGRGTGRSKHTASQEAARQALQNQEQWLGLLPGLCSGERRED